MHPQQSDGRSELRNTLSSLLPILLVGPNGQQLKVARQQFADLLRDKFIYWPPVHQSFPFRTLQRRNHPLSVRHIPIIPAETKLVAVAVKVLLGNLVEDSVVTALQKRRMIPPCRE